MVSYHVHARLRSADHRQGAGMTTISRICRILWLHMLALSVCVVSGNCHAGIRPASHPQARQLQQVDQPIRASKTCCCKEKAAGCRCVTCVGERRPDQQPAPQPVRSNDRPTDPRTVSVSPFSAIVPSAITGAQRIATPCGAVLAVSSSTLVSQQVRLQT